MADSSWLNQQAFYETKTKDQPNTKYFNIYLCLRWGWIPNHTINELKSSHLNSVSFWCGRFDSHPTQFETISAHFLYRARFWLKFTWFIWMLVWMNAPHWLRKNTNVFATKMELTNFCFSQNLRIFQLKFMIYLHIFVSIHCYMLLHWLYPADPSLVVIYVRQRRNKWMIKRYRKSVPC